MAGCSRVTVLICTWNRSVLLSETLDSLASMSIPPALAWDVVVVDNNSSDATRAMVVDRSRNFPAPLFYVFEPRQGKSCAMNAGLRHSAAPVVAFVDDDVRVVDEWLTAVVETFQTFPEVSYIGGPVDPIWDAPRPTWFDRTGTILWGTLAILDYGPDPFVFEERRRVPLGANFAIRRSLVERVGEFDTRFGRNSEQVLLGQELQEFLARAREVGGAGMYIPAMRVRHHVPARRLQPAYFRRWWYGKGISRARMEVAHPVTELGLDMRTVPKIAGIPRFLFGSAMRDAIRWMKAVASGNVADRFTAETQLCYFCGQLTERLRRLRAS
jgi:glucosyl-dolichyl phosphate glucuronosyltransferase